MNVLNKEKADKLIERVLRAQREILANLNQESIDVYKFLQAEFSKGDVTKNHLFQFVYRSFYRLDNAGLTPEFKMRYFELMEKSRSSENINPEPILKELYEILTRKDLKSFQFSFTTKLVNTINNSHPIYDSEVSKVIIGTDNRPTGEFPKKLNLYLSRHQIIKDTYSHILESNAFSSLFNEFDNSFLGNELSDFKKLDFIFWSYGKLL
jgi:hypothetical protein